MHYYTKNIADFNNATRHLNRQERSIYLDLIELQYDLESPIPDDMEWICRRVLATSESERTDVERMLNEFFDLVEQGWSNARCEHEIEHFKTKRDQAKAAGKASGEARRRNKKPRKNKNIEQSLNGRSTDVEQTLNQPITNNQQPITNKYKPQSANKFSDADMDFSEYMFDRIAMIAPKAKEPNFVNWANEIRLMRQIDGHELEEIRQVFEFANTDSFWSQNILSPATLRKQFPKLHAKMIGVRHANNRGSSTQRPESPSERSARIAREFLAEASGGDMGDPEEPWPCPRGSEHSEGERVDARVLPLKR